jgi:hypothetical protein
MSLSVQDGSLQYVKAPVSAVVDGAAYDPTSDTVQMAFTAVGVDPVSGDWKTAGWETISGRYYARCLVGPGGTIDLAVGSYTVWVKVTDSPEIPILRSGGLRVY